MTSTTRPVRPTRPVAPYVGGKRNLAGEIVRRIELIPHDTYCEPFVGMGGVFLRRRFAPTGEVINDYSRDVSTFFRILQRHYVPFLDMLRYQLTTRADFDRLKATPPDTMTDLERAARFLYLQRTSFGGKPADRTFSTGVQRASRFDITKLVPILEEVHERLSRVVIECLPWDAFIRRYDRAETLFYCDPPYYGCEHYYGPQFDRSQFEVMADVLGSIKGRFILSLNDTPEVREIFRAFRLESVNTTYSVNVAGSRKVSELLISGGGTAADRASTAVLETS